MPGCQDSGQRQDARMPASARMPGWSQLPGCQDGSLCQDARILCIARMPGWAVVPGCQDRILRQDARIETIARIGVIAEASVTKCVSIAVSRLARIASSARMPGWALDREVPGCREWPLDGWAGAL